MALDWYAPYRPLPVDDVEDVLHVGVVGLSSSDLSGGPPGALREDQSDEAEQRG